jgi:signal transduction histidine kinase
MARPRLPSSTAFRFAMFFSMAFTLVIVVMGASVYWAIRNELRYELDQRVVTARDALVREAAHDPQGLRGAIAYRVAHERGDMRYALLDASGQLVAGRPMNKPPRLGWSGIKFRMPGEPKDPARIFAARTADGGVLIVGSDPEAIEELDERMVPLFVAAFGLIAGIGAIGAFLFGRLLQRRLDAINRTAEAIIGGDLARRVPLGGNGDEFDRLAATLNHMLERIGGLLGNLRQVSGDIAHDLRTPLTRLRQKLELAEAGPDEPAALKQAMHEAIEQTDDMLALFAGILGISEIEAGGAGVRMTQVDLSALITDLADSYQPSAEDSGRTLSRDIAPGLVIEGNRELLAQAGVNLLDNALRHTPAGTAIGIGLIERGDDIVLSVSDQGPGIPAEDRERMFTRFTRLESSRSTPGHGLGLSLVAAIARAHGGTATLEDNHPGAIAMVIIPRSPR